MVRRKTSEGFARVMSKVLKYLVMFVVIYYFAAAAFVFGRQLFTDKGAAPAPGMDMTIEVTKNTSIKDFAKTLEEYGIINDDKVLFLGDGIKRIEKLLEEKDTNLTILDISQRIPKASSLLLAGRKLIDTNEVSDPMDMVPYYIRRSEAEVLWEERHKDNPAMLSLNPTVVVTEAAGAE